MRRSHIDIRIRGSPRVGLPLANDIDTQIAAPLAHRLARKRRRHDSHHTVFALVCKKAQSPEIDAQNRDTRHTDRARRSQDRSVAAQNDRHIDTAGKLVGNEGVRRETL